MPWRFFRSLGGKWCDRGKPVHGYKEEATGNDKGNAHGDRKHALPQTAAVFEQSSLRFRGLTKRIYQFLLCQLMLWVIAIQDEKVALRVLPGIRLEEEKEHTNEEDWPIEETDEHDDDCKTPECLNAMQFTEQDITGIEGCSGSNQSLYCFERPKIPLRPQE
jgi:hypothetical protein